MAETEGKKYVTWRYERYLEHKKDHPDATYAAFLVPNTLAKFERGEPHASLGPKLNAHADWTKAGERTFARYRRFFPLTPGHRVADYGCGTLRLGYHFIRFLGQDGYFGLDVAREFLDIGRQLLGPALVAEKQPRLDVITPEAMAEAAAFNPDLVISTACCYHVHPSETGEYFANLAILANKPGAVLCFDASIADQPLELDYMSWPLEFYQRSLPELTFHKFHRAADREEDGHKMTVGTLEFRRA